MFTCLPSPTGRKKEVPLPWVPPGFWLAGSRLERVYFAGMKMDESRRFVAAHTAPFLVWMGVMAALQAAEHVWEVPRVAHAWAYAAKTVACGALLLWLKPWRGGGLATKNVSRHLPLAVGAGLLVAVLWILPETPWVASRWPGFHAFYNTWLIGPPGKMPSYYDADMFPMPPPSHVSLAYSPMVCGWGLTLVKLLGTTLVIATAEEYFFRGFLYRWLRNQDFTSISLGVYDAPYFWIVVAVFAVEHDRWAGGAVAGAAYGGLALRAGDVRPAVLAHALTNFVLGVYVILSKQYGFW